MLCAVAQLVCFIGSHGEKRACVCDNRPHTDSWVDFSFVQNSQLNKVGKCFL